MHGLVVRAHKGERHTYQPVRSPLCASSQPEDIINAFLQLYLFDTLYIADLDAIQHTGSQAPIIQRLEKEYPHIEFWVDTGIATMTAYQQWVDQHESRCVIGTETLQDGSPLETLDKNAFILSLDFREDQFLGPGALLQDSILWPHDVIIMALGRVGSDQGPDYNLLEKLTAARSDKNYYAAGGVRTLDDLIRLNAMNLRGVLLASILHEGDFTAKGIEPIPCNKR